MTPAAIITALAALVGAIAYFVRSVKSDEKKKRD
jgi:hypothetical protein